MNVLAELRGKKRHKRCAAVVHIRNRKTGRAALKCRRMVSRPRKKRRFSHVTVGISCVENPVIFLEPLNKPLRGAVISPPAGFSSRLLYDVMSDGDVLGHYDLRVVIVIFRQPQTRRPWRLPPCGCRGSEV